MPLIEHHDAAVHAVKVRYERGTPQCDTNFNFKRFNRNNFIIINRMISEELTDLIASQIDVQVRQVLDRLWSSFM
jgi:hypothetical protein